MFRFPTSRYTQSFSVHDLTLVLVVLTLLVNGFELLSGRFSPSFSFLTYLQNPLETENIANLLLFPFRVASHWLELLISLYVFWIFGRHLEDQKGRLWYTWYIVVGFIFVILGTSFAPLRAYHVFFSVFLACAYLAPNIEVLLFFLFPVKIKWIAIVSLTLLYVPGLIFEAMAGSIWFLAGPFFGLANFLLFFRHDLIQRRF